MVEAMADVRRRGAGDQVVAIADHRCGAGDQVEAMADVRPRRALVEEVTMAESADAVRRTEERIPRKKKGGEGTSVVISHSGSIVE